MVTRGGNSAFLSGYEAGSTVGYFCVKWVSMLVKSPQSCAFAMVPTLMVLTPLVNNDPLLVTQSLDRREGVDSALRSWNQRLHQSEPAVDIVPFFQKKSLTRG